MVSIERIQNSRRLIGFATSFSPEVIVSEAAHGGTLGGRVASYVVERLAYVKSFIDNPVSSDAYTILINGIDDVDHMVEYAAKYHDKHASLEELIGVFNQDDTIATIGKHARLSEKLLARALFTNINNESDSDAHTLALDTDAGVLKTGEHYNTLLDWYVIDEHRGCPLATPDAEQRLDPLFVTFSKWASELSIRSLYSSRK